MPKIVYSNTIRIHDPTPDLVKWCEQNLVLTNPDYAKKIRMNLWVGNTPKKIHLYKMEGNIIELPFGVFYNIIPFIGDHAPYYEFENNKRVDYNGGFELYDFQKQVVESLYNRSVGLLQSPAGSGKTTMGLELIFKHGRPALWLTHTKDLLSQSKRRALQQIDKSLVGTITEGKVNIGEGITFATVQTMCKLNLPDYKHQWAVVVVDEAHRCAGTPTKITQFYKVVNSLAARFKYGLSATVHRSDGLIQATYALLGDIAHTVTDEEVGDKIMQVGIRPIETGIRIGRDCLNPDGTLNYVNLITYLTESEERNNLIVHHIVQNAPYSALVLSDRLLHLEGLMNALPSNLRRLVTMIDGSMVSKKQKAKREQAIEDMRTGKKKILFATYNLAKEGSDIPRLERLFMATPQKDYAIVTQSIGRIARAVEGKAEPVCYDFVDDIGYLVRSFKKRKSIYRKNNCYFVEDDHA